MLFSSFLFSLSFYTFRFFFTWAESAGTAEYVDFIFVVCQDPTPNEYSGYDSKQSDGETLVRDL